MKTERRVKKKKEVAGGCHGKNISPGRSAGNKSISFLAVLVILSSQGICDLLPLTLGQLGHFCMYRTPKGGVVSTHTLKKASETQVQLLHLVFISYILKGTCQYLHVRHGS